MKKPSLMLLTLLIIALTACSASNQANPASSAGALPAATQLILGTIKLEGTAQAVTSDQAAKLLPLWQTMKVLAASDTAAQQEKDALLAQIQETMTAGQMQAIQAMNLTRRDMASLMQQQQGLATAGTQNSSSQSGNSSRSGNRVFGPGAGGPPDEVRIQGGGGGFGGGQNFSKEQIATAQAARQANENTISPLLINAVVEYLKGKAGK